MIYVASSWRNPIHLAVVDALRSEGFDVYNFREPRPGDRGFHWSEIDPQWQGWPARNFRAALQHPLAKAGFKDDYTAMLDADEFVLVTPSGRSSHLELGWAAGMNKRTAVMLSDGDEPELMYKLADRLVVDLPELVAWLRDV